MRRKGLFRIPAGGGTPESLKQVDPGKKEICHFWPKVTPDGRSVVFMSSAGAFTTFQMELLALDARTRHTLARGESPTLTSKVVVVQNWFQELEKRVPRK